MRLTKSQRKAIELFRNFREREPTITREIEINIPEQLIVMGHLESIEYKTTHGKRAKLYRHEFAKGSRPLLCTGTGKNELLLIGGNYHVTERGVVDLDRRGREIDDDSERYD